ncbi:MAG: hypothetical protein LBS18_08605 [Clostridiales bacterium]|nr:hypothetical protein [Clostridiales bacterium]
MNISSITANSVNLIKSISHTASRNGKPAQVAVTDSLTQSVSDTWYPMYTSEAAYADQNIGETEEVEPLRPALAEALRKISWEDLTLEGFSRHINRLLNEGLITSEEATIIRNHVHRVDSMIRTLEANPGSILIGETNEEGVMIPIRTGFAFTGGAFLNFKELYDCLSSDLFPFYSQETRGFLKSFFAEIAGVSALAA